MCYVDDILCISHKLEEMMKGIQDDFKMKDDKVEEPKYYLGATVSNIRMRMVSNAGRWIQKSTVSQQ